VVLLGPLYHLGNGPTGSSHCVKPVALDDLVGVEGMPLAAWDMQARLVDPAAWQVVLGHRAGYRTRFLNYWA
jgi:hypothetical protein